MLGDVVLVLGEAVAGRDVGKLARGAEAVGPAGRLVIQKCHRRCRVRRMKRVLDGRFDRLVVLREWPVDHAVAEQAADSLAVHDEGQPGLRIVRIHHLGIVRHIANPLAAVPGDSRPRRVPRLAVEIGRGPVVHDPPVERPAPGPLREEAHAGWVVGLQVLDSVSALHEVAILGVAAGVDPIAAGRRAVVFEHREGGHLLARRQILAVDLLRDLVELGLGRVLVVKSQRHERVRELAALGLVQLLHPLEDVREYPVVMARLSLWRQHLVLPLRPAPAVDK